MLQQQLVESYTIDWSKNKFIRGAYSYSMPGTKKARAFLNRPVEGTIYFASEAFYDGPAFGTVEAALQSGKNAASLIQ